MSRTTVSVLATRASTSPIWSTAPRSSRPSCDARVSSSGGILDAHASRLRGEAARRQDRVGIDRERLVCRTEGDRTWAPGAGACEVFVPLPALSPSVPRELVGAPDLHRGPARSCMRGELAGPNTPAYRTRWRLGGGTVGPGALALRRGGERARRPRSIRRGSCGRGQDFLDGSGRGHAGDPAIEGHEVSAALDACSILRRGRDPARRQDRQDRRDLSRGGTFGEP